MPPYTARALLRWFSHRGDLSFTIRIINRSSSWRLWKDRESPGQHFTTSTHTMDFQPAANRTPPVFTKSLTGNGVPDVVVGQFSGGDNCCTEVTIIEVGKAAVRVLGKIEGITGLPFEGLDIRDIRKDKSWECVAHRSYMTSCGPHSDAADVLSIYAFVNNQYTDQTDQYGDYLEGVLRQNLAKWRQGKNPSLGFLQTLTVEFAQLDHKEEGKRFFAMNFSRFAPLLQPRAIDPNVCLDDVENLVDRLPSVQLASAPSTPATSPQANRK